MTIAETVKKLSKAQDELSNLKKEYEETKSRKQQEIKELEEKLAMGKAGLDMDRVERGLQVVSIRGKRADGSSRRGAVNDAIKDLASGGGDLKKEFCGVKNYSSFGDQRCDCPYGMGPKHGSIVFSVGLKNRNKELSPKEIEDAIYTLLNIDEVLKAKETA